MAALTVFVAPRGITAGVREALTDWSGLGLVGSFIWIEPGMVSPGSVNGLLVADGNLQAISLQSLAGTGSFDVLRLCVLVPGIAGHEQVDSAVSQRIAEMLESSFGGRPVVRVRAVVARSGETAVLDGLAQGGWHNLVLGPEEAAGPGLGHHQLHATKDPIEWGLHAAATCAGILGLWAGSTGSLLDGEAALPGESARLVRAFYRTLDATTVGTALRNDVLSLDNGVPLPTYFGTSAIYIEDSGLAARVMADQLWEKHGRALLGDREHSAPQPVTAIGPWAAFTMMFGFIWAALKNAPRSWAQRVATRVKSEAAAAVHGLVFGSAPSQYSVIVDGVGRDGLPVSWLDVRDAAATLDKLLDDAGMAREHRAPADLASFWQDFADGALTLVDAGERVTALPPVQVGTQRAVLRHASASVPGPGSGFSEIPSTLSAVIELDSVEPYDVLGILSMEERLQRAAGDPNLGIPASTALDALRRWKRVAEESYAVRVGTQIGQSLNSVRGEVQQLLNQIRRAASADDMLAGVLTRQKKLALWMKILLGGLLLGLLITGVLVAREDLQPLDGLGIWAGLAVVWLIVTLVVFMNGQRELFQLMNARSQLLSDDEISRRNLRHALRDLHRLSSAYSQFLAWSRIIGTLLAEPFGRSDDEAQAKAKFVQGLPLNVKVGTALVQPPAVAAAAAQLRHEIFAVGWLTRPWERAKATAGGLIGPRGYELTAHPEAIYRQSGDGELSLLRLWSDALDAAGTDSSPGREIWAGVLKDITGPRSGISSGLVSTVSEVRDSAVVQTSLEAFMSGVDRAPDTGRLDHFDGAVLTDVARNAGRAVVEYSVPFGSHSGLARHAGLIQLSGGIPQHEFLVARPDDRNSWLGLEPPAAEGDSRDSFIMPEGPTF
ncbi:hypothetical protein FBY31_3879 [Arthrobacter sp. SLBN-100]|uniref:hypothetical protein n=1 Tax=Arthrobacter sp. SLBN-100 TaxID=2768450 RepID=UPI001153A868|nr:hypothetical protein [Arthrobacter sp. SLBN-100]TQJ69714.1 hypothetical protein FBY31_3879 [Arthrobacter sp. SLBN-100]